MLSDDLRPGFGTVPKIFFSFIIITSRCFKDICIRSNTIKGNMMRKYYMELDELFKKFHLNKIKDISDENDYLLNNQSKNKYIFITEY